MNFRNRAALVLAAGMAPVLSFAQEVDPFATTLTTITGKVATYGGGLVALAAAGVVFGVAIKYIKKMRGAS